MLEATFSPLIPTENSEGFYIDYYNLYSFIQINDIIISHAKDSMPDNMLNYLYSALNRFNEDHKMASMLERACGIMNEATNRRRIENRGLSTEWIEKLKAKKINPLAWYQKAFEFVMIYAACEQAVKEFINLKRITDNIKSEAEVNLIDLLIKTLSENKLFDCFLEEMKDATASIIDSGNQLDSLWRFYTIYRHAIAHAGGKNTAKIKEKMDSVIVKNKHSLDTVRKNMNYEIGLDYDDEFFISPFIDEIIDISDKHINFFRNMSLFIVESLERTLHPDEYKIDEFNPYKM